MFTEKDLENLAKLLNLVAERAVFKDLSVKDVITTYGLFAWAQKDLIKKIEDHILEVKALREIKPQEPEPKPKKGKAK